MSNARGMPGAGMLKLRFDRYITKEREPEPVCVSDSKVRRLLDLLQMLGFK